MLNKNNLPLNVLELKETTNMKHLEIVTKGASKNEITELLNSHNIKWEDSTVICLSANIQEIATIFVQVTPAVGALATVIVKWLNVKASRKVKIMENASLGTREVEVTGFSLREVEKIISIKISPTIIFEEPTSSKHAGIIYGDIKTIEKDD